jgi:hypothetical protein
VCGYPLLIAPLPRTSAWRTDRPPHGAPGTLYANPSV